MSSARRYEALRAPNGEFLPPEYMYLLVNHVRHIGSWHLISSQAESDTLRAAYKRESGGIDCVPFARGGADGDDIAGFIVEINANGQPICSPKVVVSHLTYSNQPYLSEKSENKTPICLSVWEWLSSVVVADLKADCEGQSSEDLFDEWSYSNYE